MLQVAREIAAAECVTGEGDHAALCSISVKDQALPFLVFESRSFHNDILRPPRKRCVAQTGDQYEEPFCVMGSKCVALRRELGGPGGLILRAKPSTLEDLVAERETGHVRCAGEPCLLCSRWQDAQDVTLAVQETQTDEHQAVLQDHYVGTDPSDPEHYHRDACYDPALYACVFLPIICFHISDYKWVQDPNTGEWWVNQDALGEPRP